MLCNPSQFSTWFAIRKTGSFWKPDSWSVNCRSSPHSSQATRPANQCGNLTSSKIAFHWFKNLWLWWRLAKLWDLNCFASSGKKCRCCQLYSFLRLFKRFNSGLPICRYRSRYQRLWRLFHGHSRSFGAWMSGRKLWYQLWTKWAD